MAATEDEYRLFTQQRKIEELERQNWVLDYALNEIIKQFDYGNDMKWVQSTKDIMISFGESAYMRHKNTIKEMES